MIARPVHPTILTYFLLSQAMLAGVSCQKVPLLAPSGSTITLTSGASALPMNGTTPIIAQVIEASGTPPHSGTLVTFTTTFGTIQPASVETDITGRAVATFSAGAASGTATITASSGGATVTTANAVKILVGTAAVGRVVVSANPTLVPAVGGTSAISAVIIDVNGNPLASAPVSFSTTAGTLADALVAADQNGVAQTTLRTSTQATVTASVGGTGTPATASGTVVVGIASSPTLVITPPTTTPLAGLPASFTFAVTAAAANGSSVRGVTVNWGDGGQAQDLGAITGTATIAHVYKSAGSYSIAAVLTDNSGNVVSVFSFVTVNTPVLTLTITPPSSPPSANLPASFTFAATAPAGDAVRDVTVNWGDGSAPQDLGAIFGTSTASHVFKTAGTYLITGTVVDVAGNSASVSTSVTVIPVPRPTIIITPSPVPGKVNTQTNLTIQVTLPAGISVQDLSIAFGDGQTSALGGATSASVPHVYTTQGTFTVTVTVLDTTGQTTVGTAAVSIGP